MAKLRKYTTEELLGKRFGSYTLLEHYEKPNESGRNNHWWKCRCECGNIVERRESRVIYNKRKQCVCQYKPKENGDRSPLWRGHGDISGSYLAEIRLNARQHNLEFALTVEMLWELFLEQDKKCALTGVEIGFKIKKLEDDGTSSTTFQTASLDRVDSKKGYTRDNVWWVHKDVNRMKNAYSMREFVMVCHRVAERFDKPTDEENPDWVYKKNAKVN